MNEYCLNCCSVRDFAERLGSDTQKVVRPLGFVLFVCFAAGQYLLLRLFWRGSSLISLLKTASESTSLSGSKSLAAVSANKAASANAFGKATCTNNSPLLLRSCLPSVITSSPRTDLRVPVSCNCNDCLLIRS